MGKYGITYTVKITGVRETLAAFRELPKDASNELRDKSQEMAGELVDGIRARAAAERRQWGILAATVKARRDRVPTVEAGGKTRIGRRRVEAFHLIGGAEFGATYLKQFKPRNSPAGYVFFPTAVRMGARFDEAWNQVATDIIARWSE